MATATANGATNTSTGVLAIGRTGSSATDYFEGAIDEVAFYPTALSSSWIYAYYAAGRQLGTGPASIAQMASTILTVAGAPVASGSMACQRWTA